VQSKEVQVQWGFSKGTFAARLLDDKFPAPAAMEPADPEDEALYARLLRDCVTFKPKPMGTEQSPADAEVSPYP